MLVVMQMKAPVYAHPLAVTAPAELPRPCPCGGSKTRALIGPFLIPSNQWRCAVWSPAFSATISPALLGWAPGRAARSGGGNSHSEILINTPNTLYTIPPQKKTRPISSLFYLNMK